MNLPINERYAKVEGFDDYYITESGRVWSTRPIGVSKTSRLHEMKPKNPGKNSKYLNIIFCTNNGVQKTFSIHRLVATYFVDGYFDGAVVNHKDGNNRNNHYTNLEWVTQKENIHQSYKTSGMNQVRNHKVWSLFDPEGNLVSRFKDHFRLEEFVLSNHLPTSPSSLTKYRKSNGYSVIVE